MEVMHEQIPLFYFLTILMFYPLPTIEMIKKKFSLDFIFKENFVWLESLSRSIHWYA